jgi:hypothetical protein
MSVVSRSPAALPGIGGGAPGRGRPSWCPVARSAHRLREVAAKRGRPPGPMSPGERYSRGDGSLRLPDLATAAPPRQSGRRTAGPSEARHRRARRQRSVGTRPRLRPMRSRPEGRTGNGVLASAETIPASPSARAGSPATHRTLTPRPWCSLQQRSCTMLTLRSGYPWSRRDNFQAQNQRSRFAASSSTPCCGWSSTTSASRYSGSLKASAESESARLPGRRAG